MEQSNYNLINRFVIIWKIKTSKKYNKNISKQTVKVLTVTLHENMFKSFDNFHK